MCAPGQSFEDTHTEFIDSEIYNEISSGKIAILIITIIRYETVFGSEYEYRQVAIYNTERKGFGYYRKGNEYKQLH